MNKTNLTQIYAHGFDETDICKPANITENDEILCRSEISKLACFNLIYKDGNKYYLENPVEAAARLLKRLKISFDDYTYEQAEYCLYLAGYDMRKAKKVYGERYI